MNEEELEKWFIQRHYKLNRLGEPVPCEGLLDWGKWLETAERQVAYTEFPDGTWLSTVFLGLDHNYSPKGPPILWETMIFAESDFARQFDGEQRRYTSRKEALAGHAELCAELAVGLQVN